MSPRPPRLHEIQSQKNHIYLHTYTYRNVLHVQFLQNGKRTSNDCVYIIINKDKNKSKNPGNSGTKKSINKMQDSACKVSKNQ